jgi:Kef-type K+ transport system membrane component KefB
VHVEHTHLLSFLLLLALIIAAAKAAGWVSLRFGQPAVLGEILAGVLLGPSLFDILNSPVFREAELGAVVAHLANVGVIFLMFIAGLETNLEQVRKVGTVATLAGISGVFAPLVLGLLAALLFDYPLKQAMFFGIVLTATSVSITVQTLIELGRLESKEGTALLAAAVIDDVIAIVVLSVFISLSGASGGGSAVGLTVIRMAAFFVLSIWVGMRLMRRLLPQAGTWPVSEGLLAVVAVVVLVFSWMAEAFGRVASITGAYIAGILVASVGHREQVEHRLKAFVYALLVPVFFISIGLQTNARLLNAQDIPFTAVIILVAVLGKVLGCGGGALAGGFAPREALRIGVGMVSRGEVGLIIAAIGVQSGLLNERGFAVMVITVLVTTVITPVLLRATFPRPLQPLTEAEAVSIVMGEEE